MKPETVGKQIAFSVPMVQAILNNHKCQTRRIVRDVPAEARHAITIDGKFVWLNSFMDSIGYTFDCPYGRELSMLYLREDFRVSSFYDRMQPSQVPAEVEVHYEADGYPSARFGRARECRYMMRWMSRITLQIKSLRIERLQDISDGDCILEGITPADVELASKYMEELPALGQVTLRGNTPPRWAYAKLWEKIHGAGSWQINPFVWVIEFDHQHGNIDEILAQQEEA